MVKGSERRVVVIEKVDSPYFEKAVFFIKKGARRQTSKKTLAAVAEELIEQYMQEEEPVPVVRLVGGAEAAAPVRMAASTGWRPAGPALSPARPGTPASARRGKIPLPVWLAAGGGAVLLTAAALLLLL